MNQNPQQEQAHPAAVAQEFMRRADMKGGEVEAFGQTFNWLGSFLDGETVATPKEAHELLMQELKELRTFKREHEEAQVKADGEEAGELPVLEPEQPAAGQIIEAELAETPALELEAVESETEHTE